MLAASTIAFGVFWAFIEACIDGTPAFSRSWSRGVIIFATIHIVGVIISAA